MKAFTVFQPYAFAIVAGLKGYETRPRRTNIRGRVAVHAAKRIWSVEDMEILYHLLPADWPQDFGAVIGTVEIVDCVPVEEIVDSLTASEKLFGDYSPGRFAWVLKDPVRFEKPIPARGNQGWWNWEEPAEGSETP
ncbi:ASCH domain-containing protein [uncultured Dysosmobacter sp.]|uniref:ASCH domain-containing protein n=1 Tax=uncultured Dysosmobacter sp. TaxID=2591384 RepID=UPI0026230532|nr:ASCH domain-containing protein [uncultured Dysosmobacter sp.]